MKKIRNLMVMLVIAAFTALLFVAPVQAAYSVKQVFLRISVNAGETLTTGDVVMIKDADGEAYKADANDSDLRPAVGIVGSKTGGDGEAVEIIIAGILTGWSSLSEGGNGYLSETAAAVTQSAPSYSQKVGFAINTTDYLFNFQNYFDTSAVTALGVLTGATPIILEGATADDYETTIAPTDPTADRTVTVPDSDVDLGNVGVFTIAIHHEGQETATLNPTAAFQMPFAATLTEVSVHARDIDTTDTDETYTVDIEEAGTSVLSSAISITADDTAVVGTISDSAIADNAKIEVVLTLGGTTPTIDDLTVLLTFQK